MHEEKDWGRRPDDQAGGDHAPSHYPRVTPSLALLHSAQWYLFSIRQLDGVDAYIEFASTTHPSFLVGRDNGS
jgi:hypothetical protein